MNESNFLPRWVSIGLIPLINLLLAFLVSGIVIFFIGENPLQAILVMIKGAFYYPGSIGYTLYYTTNFIFAGLAVALAECCISSGLGSNYLISGEKGKPTLVGLV